MCKRQWFGLGALIGGLALVFFDASPVQSQRPPKEETLSQRIARRSKLTDENAIKFLEALGPAIREELGRGKTVSINGLGQFRVVQVPAHKDLRKGRPVTIEANNTVEFLPAGEMNDAANSENAKPAEVVPPFEYNPLPGQTPGQKTGRTRTPPVRTP